MIPVGRAQVMGIPSEVHWVGMEVFGEGGFGAKMVTPVRTYTPDSILLGFLKESGVVLDRGNGWVKEMGNLSSLYLPLSEAEEDVGKTPHDLDQAFHPLAGVPCEIFLVCIPPVSVEQAAVWCIERYYRFFYWRAVRYYCGIPTREPRAH